MDFLCHSFLARVCALEEALFFQLNLLGSFEPTINNDRAMVYTVGTCSIPKGLKLLCTSYTLWK